MIPGIIASLSEFLGGTVSDEFKKLFQPHSVVATSIFLILNWMLVIHPLATNSDMAILEDIANQPWVLQLAIGTWLVLICIYVVNVLGDFFVSLVSGELFHDTLIGSLLINWQEWRYDNLKGDVNDEEQSEQTRVKTLRRLAYHFPLETEEESTADYPPLRLTALGNILANPASYSQLQYGAPLATVWPVLQTVLEEKNKQLNQRIQETWKTLVFTATLTTLLFILAVEVLLLPVEMEPRSLVKAVIILVLGILIHQLTLAKARTWAIDVRRAIDLYLDDVASEFALYEMKLSELDEYKERWSQFSRWLAYGPVKQDVHKWAKPIANPFWYKEKPISQRLIVKHPPTVDITQFDPEDSTDWIFDNTRWSISEKCIIQYRFGIVNPGQEGAIQPADNVYLAIADSQLLSPPAGLLGHLRNVKANQKVLQFEQGVEVISEQRNGSLLWPIGTLNPCTSLLLDYEVEVDSGNFMELMADATKVKVTGSSHDLDSKMICWQIAMIKKMPSFTLTARVHGSFFMKIDADLVVEPFGRVISGIPASNKEVTWEISREKGWPKETNLELTVFYTPSTE